MHCTRQKVAFIRAYPPNGSAKQVDIEYWMLERSAFIAERLLLTNETTRRPNDEMVDD